MSEEYTLTFNDYLDIARRRWPYFLVASITSFGIAVLVAVLLPPVYSSKGLILVETQQIPDELIRSTITGFVDERIEVIKQRVMTRSNQLKIIDKYNLFKDSGLTVSEQLEAMRERIKIDKVQSKQNRRNLTTIAFSVGFEHKSPRITNNVANDLVTLFLDENVKTRTERATETTDFLQQEAKKLKSDLEKTETRIAQFKQENSNALPEHLDLHLSILERTENSIKDIKREIKSSQEELRFLEVELSAVKVSARQSPTNAPVSERRAIENQLNANRNRLAELKGKYSLSHPDVKKLVRQIEEQEKELEALPETSNSNSSQSKSLQDIEIQRVRTRMNATEDRIKSLEQQKTSLEKKREELEKTVIQTPQVQKALVSLERDYENLLKKYKEIQGKELEAKLSESLEENKKAERFSLIEPPVFPDRPIKPNRIMVVGVGFVAAMGIGLALVVLLELLNQRVRGAAALTALLKERPLMVVPYITTENELYRKKRLIKRIFYIGVITVLAVLVLMHFLYMPLDMVLYKVMARFG